MCGWLHIIRYEGGGGGRRWRVGNKRILHYQKGGGRREKITLNISFLHCCEPVLTHLTLCRRASFYFSPLSSIDLYAPHLSFSSLYPCILISSPPRHTSFPLFFFLFASKPNKRKSEKERKKDIDSATTFLEVYPYFPTFRWTLTVHPSQQTSTAGEWQNCIIYLYTYTFLSSISIPRSFTRSIYWKEEQYRLERQKIKNEESHTIYTVTHSHTRVWQKKLGP